MRKNLCLPAAALLAIILAACSSMNGSDTAAVPALSKERIAEIVAAPDRSDADRTNDIRRKPAEILEFIGVRPGMVALDISAGGGYTTELIARAVGPTGRVYGQSTPPRDPNRPAPAPAAPEGGAAPAPAPALVSAAPAPVARPAGGLPNSVTALAERAKKPAASNILSIVGKFEDPAPAELKTNGFDLVTLMFNYHDFGFLGVDRAQTNKAVFDALKPGGLYVLADHSGRPGTGISESGTLHRIEQAFLVKEIEAAGFKLVAEGNFLRNPNDPRDKNVPIPAQPKDDFVVKFVKP